MTTQSGCSTVPQAIIMRASDAPGGIAVCAQSKRLTYLDLDTQANRLARYLRSLGVDKGVLVGVCLPRSLDMVVGMMAIWKAGGAYLPMDPTDPPHRLASILDDAQVRIVLSTPEVSGKLAETGCQFIHPGSAGVVEQSPE